MKPLPRRLLRGALSAAALIALAAPSGALQLTLGGTERINEFGSGLPGTPYATPSNGVDYDQIGGAGAHPGKMLLTGTIPTLNYHTTVAPGTNQSFSFGPDLQFQLDAALTGITLQDVGGGNVQLTLEFSGTADGLPDLVVTDPSDNTVVLEANLVAGDLNGNPVAPITSVGTFSAASPPSNQVLQTFGFFEVDPGSPYASLFADSAAGSIGLSTGTASGWEIGDLDGSSDFDDLVAAFGDPPQLGELLSHTAEASGNVFGVSSASFNPVPEASTLMMLGAGFAGLVWAGRRREGDRG